MQGTPLRFNNAALAPSRRAVTHGALVSLLLMVLLSACAPNRPYRTESQIDNPCIAAVSTDCSGDTYFERSALSADSPGVAIGVIEFDDTGSLMNRAHKDRLIAKIKTTTSEQDVIMAIFAHGWKHNASADDSNFRDFQDFVLKLAEAEHAMCVDTDCRPRKIIGVYLGWRGLSATLPVLKTLSFWNRKERAERVGQDGVTEVLSELRRIQTLRRTDPVTGKKQRTNNNKLVLVGHSFGGALLFSATQQVLQQSTSFLINNDIPRLMADMVVLVNPAFEAGRMSAIFDRAQTLSFDESQRTLLAVFTSRADIATKYAFPLGRWFSTLFNSYREEYRQEQYARDTTAIGHYEPYITHSLDLEALPLADQAYTTAQCRWADYKGGVSDEWAHGNGVVLSRRELIKTPTQRNNPFINVSVADTLISGHNSIWGDQFRQFLTRFVAVQDAEPCTPQ